MSRFRCNLGFPGVPTSQFDSDEDDADLTEDEDHMIFDCSGYSYARYLGKSGVPRRLRRCTVCTTRAMGDAAAASLPQHCIVDCPRVDHVFRIFMSMRSFLLMPNGAGRSLMWLCLRLCYWPLFQRPKHEDKFVLIGHCWLYNPVNFRLLLPLP